MTGSDTNIEDDMDHANWHPGLLCDEQIKHLAMHHAMIAPFEPNPVRFDPEPRCTCTCSAGKHGSTGCRTQFGDRNTGHECPCPWRGPEGGERVVSYGLGHYGYDIRVAGEFKVFTNANSAIVDPKGMSEKAFVAIEGDCVIPPNSFALARSVECFRIPRDVLGIVLGKSTYARCGLVVNCTPLEPAWKGYVTLEISNTTPLPAKVYANEGIAQVLFHKASRTCKRSYADKAGKYQSQGPEVVLPRM